MSITNGTVAFESLSEHEQYNGQSTGKYSITLTMDESEGKALEDMGVKMRDYNGEAQRKFSSKYPVAVLDTDDEPFMGRVGRGSKVRVLWQEGKPHPVHGVPTYLNKVRVLELAENHVEGEENF